MRRRFFQTLTKPVWETAIEITHHRLLFHTYHHCVLNKDLQKRLEISAATSKSLGEELRKSTNQQKIIKEIGNMISEEDGILYSPFGILIRTTILEWMGGCFDGDGCVTMCGGKPGLFLTQNSHYVEVFHICFGGSISKRGKLNSWSAKGFRCYITAKILEKYTIKKQSELLEVIKFYEGITSRSECQENIRSLKDSYQTSNFDISQAPYPYIAGLIDSDGSVSLATRSHHGSKYFYPIVSFYQCNERICQNLKCRFGGSSHKRSDDSRKFAWTLQGLKCIEFLSAVHPYMLHKREQAGILLQRESQYDRNTWKYIFALNCKNHAASSARFKERFEEDPKDFLESF